MTNYNPYSLNGKTILITGASSGIGKAAAIECAKMGANVVLVGRNEQRLKETYEECVSNGISAHIIIADISKGNDLDRVVEQCHNIDGLVNNAGVIKTLPVQFVKKDDIDDVLNVNLYGPMLLQQKILRKKKISKGGSIVYTCSMCGVYNVEFANGIYAASKGALNAWMKTSALELAQKGIRVNSVCPGMVDTNIMNDSVVTAEERKADSKAYPLKRYGKPEEIAKSIVFLLSDATSWMTGTALLIDGGFTLR